MNKLELERAVDSVKQAAESEIYDLRQEYVQSNCKFKKGDVLSWEGMPDLLVVAPLHYMFEGGYWRHMCKLVSKE